MRCSSDEWSTIAVTFCQKEYVIWSAHRWRLFMLRSIRSSVVNFGIGIVSSFRRKRFIFFRPLVDVYFRIGSFRCCPALSSGRLSWWPHPFSVSIHVVAFLCAWRCQRFQLWFLTTHIHLYIYILSRTGLLINLCSMFARVNNSFRMSLWTSMLSSICCTECVDTRWMIVWFTLHVCRLTAVDRGRFHGFCS